MRSQLAALRARNPPSSLTAIPPASSSTEYSTRLADLATRILYRSPLPSRNDLPVFILNAGALPDAKDTDYDALLPYVLARLPDEEELIGGYGYELVFFAGGSSDGATGAKKARPGVGWFFQAYHILSRAMRKRLKMLYIVHEKNWIRILIEMFSTVVSPKFRKKVVHVSTLSGLALHIQIEDLLIPPSAYLVDRRFSKDIHVPYMAGRRAFAVQQPLPISASGAPRLPRVLREATSFVIMDPVIKAEGIFRVSPRSMMVNILAEAYDRGQKFIVWREGNVSLSHSHRREGMGDVWVDEVEQTEGYDIHTAATLIKQWYKELREPIFPQSCYAALERFYGTTSGETVEPLEISQLVDILSDNENWSPIGKTAKKILTMHLLPLLSRLTEFQDWNQMTPYNLVVCFGPCLLRGPDPLEDVKVASTIRRILAAMILHWKDNLALHFEMSVWKFEESLRLPEAVEDREDPLQEVQKRRSSLEDQISGITLVDNDDSDEEIGQKPPLPPRPVASPTESGFPSTGAVRRKPAPALPSLPRYSVIVTERPVTLENMPFYNTVAPEEDAERLYDLQNDLELPLYMASSPPVAEKALPAIPAGPMVIPAIADTMTATPATMTSAKADLLADTQTPAAPATGVSTSDILATDVPAPDVILAMAAKATPGTADPATAPPKASSVSDSPATDTSATSIQATASPASIVMRKPLPLSKS